MDRILRRKWRNRQGLTLMELLTAVAILCVIAAIAIPAAAELVHTLEFQKRNQYAKSIFLAAQTELVEMRSNGELALLEGNPAAAQMQLDGAAPPSGCVYAASRDETWFPLLLPPGSIEETVRDGQIIIEYSPRTGSVFAVFYYEGEENLAADYGRGILSRDADERKKQKLGYYDGSDLTDPDLGVYYVEAELSFENGQESIVTVAVPMQAVVSGEHINFMEDRTAFAAGLEIILTITGEQGGTFQKTLKAYGDQGNTVQSSGEGGVQTVSFSCPLDSLVDMGSFASLPENCPEGVPAGRVVTDIGRGDYAIKPGDNVSIAAEVTFRPGLEDPMVIIGSAAIAGVNPMFASLTPGTDGYILGISNGRHLQNLNAIAPEIAQNVEAVVFFPDQAGKPGTESSAKIIDWNDTVTYYENYKNSAAEAPARSLPYFVPIHNEYLFGTVALKESGGAAVPELQEVNVTGRKGNADIVGNGVRIYNLKIDTGKYATNRTFYAGSAAAADYKMAGLFGYINTKIDGVYVVNPEIRNEPVRDGGRFSASAAGALVGMAGADTYISHCGAYIDTQAVDFDSARLNLDSFAGEKDRYGVSGYGAVGGLVGYAKACTVSQSFGAVSVYGRMQQGAYCGQGNGVGGLAGNAQAAHFRSCYASGPVSAAGCAVLSGAAENALGITALGAESMGAGGFVGTSHGCVYTDCFASGNVRGTDSTTGTFAGVMCVDSRLDRQKMKLSGCYGAGLVDTGVYSTRFWGEAAIWNPANMPASLAVQRCYYLSRYLESEEQAVRTGAKPCTFAQLGSRETDGFAAWSSVSAAHTHTYLPQQEGQGYPFLLPAGLTDYYGLWPEETIHIAAAYYEIYESGEAVYCLDAGDEAALGDGPVLEDGYVVLSATEAVTARAGGSALALEPMAQTAEVNGNAYYRFRLPLAALGEAAGADFYAKVDLEAAVQGSDGHRETRTVYINPDVAMGQLNGASQMPRIPETIRIRSARQLTALGGGHMKHFLDLRYVQQTDVALSGREWEPINGFSGTYDGSEKTISGVSQSLFGTNSGGIQNVNLQIQQQGRLAAYNSGGIQDCTVTGTGPLAGAGLVGTNAGTIENCIINAAVSLDGTKTAGILVDEMLDGSIRSCGISGTLDARRCSGDAAAGGVVGCMNAGTIASVTSDAQVMAENTGRVGTFAGAVEEGALRDCHTTAANDTLPFIGHAQVLQETPIHAEATHYAAAFYPDGLTSGEEVTERLDRITDDLPTKPSYAAAFENCTFLLSGRKTDALGKRYYYGVTPAGSQKLAAVPPGTAELTPGNYVLITEEGSILTFTEGGTLARIPKGEQTTMEDGMVWSYDGTQWIVEKSVNVKTGKTEAGSQETVTETDTEFTLTATVTPAEGSSESCLTVTVAYEITAVSAKTQTMGDGTSVTQTETRTAASGRETCLLYALTEETDCIVTCVDSGYALVVPDNRK